jgi:hypothetical protein
MTELYVGDIVYVNGDVILNETGRDEGQITSIENRIGQIIWYITGNDTYTIKLDSGEYAVNVHREQIKKEGIVSDSSAQMIESVQKELGFHISPEEDQHLVQH